MGELTCASCPEFHPFGEGSNLTGCFLWKGIRKASQAVCRMQDLLSLKEQIERVVLFQKSGSLSSDGLEGSSCSGSDAQFATSGQSNGPRTT